VFLSPYDLQLSYIEDKIIDLATNSKNKDIRDLCRAIKDFKMCYQPRRNSVKDVSSGLLADSHNNFSQLLNVHGASDVRQVEIHAAESLVPDPSPFESEIAIAKQESYKPSVSDQIPAELIHEEGKYYVLQPRNSLILF
jgi:hypothetical protein